jgi:hypothetical protein
MVLIHVYLIPNAIGYGLDKWKNYKETNFIGDIKILNNIENLDVEFL